MSRSTHEQRHGRRSARGRRRRGRARGVVLSTGAAFALSSACSEATSPPQGPGEGETRGAASSLPALPDCQRVQLVEFVPEAARYAPGTVVSLRARLTASDPDPCNTRLELEVTHLGEVIHRETQTIPLSTGIEQTAVLRWQPPARDFVGYMARATAPPSGEERTTGVDVSSSAYVYPRYGFLSAFPPRQTPLESRLIVSTLSERYHISLFQLYDWFWRHEDLLPREEDGQLAETWPDLFGRVSSRSTLRSLIDAVHAENGRALAYVTAYAAREGYEQLSAVSPAWGVFEGPAADVQVNLDFGAGRRLFLFDPSNPSWQARMAEEYSEAINELGFDGVQIDQFGPRPTYYRADGAPVELRETFAPFLESIDAALTANDPARAVCVFNLVDGEVDGYAVEEVTRSSACDVLYSEIWFTTDTYEELRAYIEQLRASGGGRPVVLALYPQYGEDVGIVLQAEDAMLEGVTVASDHEGYTGSGFVAQFDGVGDAITWQQDFESDPLVSFVFRHANASGAPATRTLSIDDVPEAKLTFPSRGSWSDWSFDAWAQQYVAAGRHQLTLRYAEDDVGVVNIDRVTLGQLDEPSVRLQNAVVFASGATPIQIGDDVQSLVHEYFPNRSKTLPRSLREALRSQYSFITAHETLLFARELSPIQERLEKLSAVSPGHRLIAEGSDGIWTVLRKAPEGDVIHLINLNGVGDALWRDAAPRPVAQEDVVLRYRVQQPSAVTAILWATPDAGPGTFSRLEFTRGEGYVELTLPRLDYWDVILVRF